MKALVLCPAPSYRDDLPMPLPSPGEALLRVRLAGICNTDLELSRGYMGFKGVPGHEFVADVVALNPPDPDHPLMGRRVTGEINASCGSCAFCMRGLGTHCPSRTVLGILGRQGSMAEYLTLPAANLHTIPEGVPDEAAVFTEPLAAAYEILEQVDAGPGMSVLVMGDGKLGILCAMVIAQSGADVTLLGRHERKLALASPCGVRTLSDPASLAPPYDLLVEATGSAEALPHAMGLVRPRGTIVLKTTAASGSPLNLAPVVINELTVVGSRCGPFGPALKAISTGAIDPTVLIEATYPLEQAAQAFVHASRKGSLKVLLDCSGRPGD